MTISPSFSDSRTDNYGGQAIFGAAGFSNADYPSGLATFVIYAIEHGIEIASIEAQARITKSLYLTKRKIDAFILTIKLTSYAEYVKASTYFRNYIEFVLNPDNEGTINPMVVVFPQRNFTMMGIPSGGFNYGKTAGEFTWMMTIPFVGTINPTVVSEEGSTGIYTDADPKSVYYYPLGDQAGSAKDNLDVAYFDIPTATKRTNAPAPPGTTFTDYLSTQTNWVP